MRHLPTVYIIYDMFVHCNKKLALFAGFWLNPGIDYAHDIDASDHGLHHE
jgi:hypothetical protein